ncbi:MAG: hypothetical protein ABH834_07375 [Candidatus Altiarchaeota archaeon]
MHEDNALKNAENHIFSTGLSDAGSVLARANMKYGLAKIHALQSGFGIKSDATFISAPDESPNKNKTAWTNGISKGGKLAWGPGNEKLILLDARPAVCGMLVGGLDKLPETKELTKKVHSLKDEKLELDGIPLQWDFGKGNHFIDVFSVRNLNGMDLPEYAFIIHASAPELNGDNPLGFGLQYDKSTLLSDMMCVEETPYGNAHVLYDGEATEYMGFHDYAEDFAKRRRKMVGEMLFGEFTELSNPTHQKLLNMNEMVLGVYDTEDEGEDVFPITLRADLPAYLVKGRRSFTRKMIDGLGFGDRAKDLGVYNNLKSANIIPHGGGMNILGVTDVTGVFEVGGVRYFNLNSRRSIGEYYISDVQNLPFAYRDTRVVEKAVELGMCEIEAELHPEIVLKV